ncbi:MAG: LacI family DNA-binding transcriptional regulator [Atopobiaceae bacterium]|nr:LacI family DNA-binding transcriptional regulator [Atopobiaceae bacterium]
MNINEIAKRAGVSRATVSRYLNDGYVSQEKRTRISRIIEETGYVPSSQAQQLRNGKTHLVGVIIPKINSQSVSRMVEGVTSKLAEHGYQVLLANTENDESKEIEYLRILNQGDRVDGIILLGTVFNEAHEKVIRRLRVPFVVLDQHFEGHACIYQDDYHAVRDLTQLALSTARKPAYIGVFEEDRAVGVMRRQGFLDACAQVGIDVLPEAMQFASFTSDSGYFAAEKILEHVPDVDTIVCATDEMAFGAIMYMREYGKRVPEDVQVTGVGDSPMSRIIIPALSTVHLPFKTSGIKAAEMLLRQISFPNENPVSICMPYEVYQRNSLR